MASWKWQVGRHLDDIRETLEEKGWEYVLDERDDSDAMPLLAESGNYCISFFERDPGTGECWFELRDRVLRRVVFVGDAQNIPMPEQTPMLLAYHGVPSYEVSAPRSRPLYSLPAVPVLAEVG